MFRLFKQPQNRLGRFVSGTFDPALGTACERRAAWWHLMLFDHGFLRGVWTNMAEIAPGVWRSNQPSPRRLKQLKARGITTILSLRGDAPTSHHLLEKRTCEALGIKLVLASFSARQAPGRKRLIELLDHFDRLEPPFLIHCKSGADRAGLASALYLIYKQGLPADEAAKMLSLRFLHLKNTKTGIMDAFVDLYRADTADAPQDLREWITTRYSRKRLLASLASPPAEAG